MEEGSVAPDVSRAEVEVRSWLGPKVAGDSGGIVTLEIEEDKRSWVLRDVDEGPSSGLKLSDDNEDEAAL